MKRKQRSDAVSSPTARAASTRRLRSTEVSSPSQENAGASPANADEIEAETTSQAPVEESRRGRGGVTRERALYFATGESAPPRAPRDVEEEKESWPGYFATARDLSDRREEAQAKRKQRQEQEEQEQETEKLRWQPKRAPRAAVATADKVVKKLKDLALQTLAQHVEQLPTLEYIDATARHLVAREVVKLRRLKPEVLPLFIFPGVTEIDLPDCSNIDEATLIKALKECAAHGLDLTVLRLGLCGRCVSDGVIQELGDALKSVEHLQVQGCYRLSDAGCEALVRRCAPSLDSFEISCNQRITKKSIDYFCELQNLHSLSLSECPQIEDASLESLRSMKNLRKLQLNQLERLSDAFVGDLARSLPELQEFSIARCSQLTNNAVESILNACRSLKELDVSDLHQITDSCFEPVRTHQHALSRVSMRCCLGLTDIAVEHIAFGANEYLEILEMSSVSQATDVSMLSLKEHCASGLRTLDISFCRSISEDAVGVLVDEAEKLTSLVLWGCTQITARFLRCHSQDDLIVTGHPLLTGLSIRY
ncbi:hypothetical protein PHYBOEH_002847 [Phytophthora boehmeriae]|uniref:F-box/LRR-repeat protein 15-like leucin rich repeat domain-containing protein n=1 Tax=Phytophthora boehmeriae TaxID=109152 RepID=A0A8T1WTP6_9STRA|nr:hypothetical protein PHYBOEH_002847 [Phytophthora boehmeriae]